MSDVPPAKPWEINRIQNGAGFGPLHSNLSTAVPETVPTIGTTGQNLQRKSTPPPVPNRPNQMSSTPIGYQPSYGGGYGSYGYGTGYGGYGGFGSMPGSYGGYYGSYNRPHGTPGGFTSQAEESTRNAFQSVESIVRAFTSVSTMLESTLGAVYSSFRAVLDVADQFSRVRATFADILSSIAVFRAIRYLYRRVKAFLHLGGQCEEAWDTVTDESSSVVRKAPKSKSWPMLLFISVVIGGPYLIWKLLSGAVSKPKPPTDWASGLADHVVARVEYDFEGGNDDEISVKAGDMLNLAPKEQQTHIRDWLVASLDGTNVGMVPANYVKILGRRKGRQVSMPETVDPASKINTGPAPDTNSSPGALPTSTDTGSSDEQS